MAARRQKAVNVARKKPVTAREANAIAQRQIWQREFNPDYDQMVLRISNGPFCGLRNGQAPPCVT
jgi:hypothetical protein